MQKDIEELVKKGAAPEGLPVVSIPPAPPKPKSIKKKPSKKYGPYHVLGKVFSKQVVISVIFIAIILLIAGGVYYWWNYLRAPEKTESAGPRPVGPGPKIPVFLVGADEIEIIESLEINIPTNISDFLEEEYTFFLYSQDRVGFVVKIVDYEINLQNWEKTMPEDLKPMFLEQELGEPATEEFQDNTYKDVNIRYLNFSDPSLTLDYAVVGEYLIVTTSKESMYGVIDRVMGKP